MKKQINPQLIWFISSYIIFHFILFVMQGEKEVFWYLYTGIMMIAGISYVFYQREIKSKRLLQSIGYGLIGAVLLVILQLLLSQIYNGLSYASLLKELMQAGVFYKWQMLVTIVIAIPCHELYIRTILQNQLQLKFSQPLVAIVVSAFASSSLFLYLNHFAIFIFIFLAQLILSTLYFHTKRIVTSYIAQVAAIIILVIIFS
ncbi:type II CAAX prenyl endopeptidase Rce1 family protein [Mammaliicoccus vitulinus]|uniref:CPBP family intramembrane metalloprotease n=1 Tax=Mammaliicoccus vitulinus TaxID=71237 RepID=A0ABX7HGC8_9STAP|nr:CPBP family glutamic-type intramembrane protease [Mammaliicoccus vitulinus]PNZ38656.1 CPBP family intramembrane metalloprotease [Mammaliicoccus vitulinus]QRO85307.1 CPBP family intramembrane metalloprotease [Mammaliicoccus vitulinus]